MKKRNYIADAFFESVSSFSQKSGAVDFDSGAEYDKKSKSELLSMTCTAYYSDFKIEYTYSVRTQYNAVSVFSFRIIFRGSQIKYSPYDLMPFIDADDFSCLTFGYIESPEKMKAVFSSIEDELYKIINRCSVTAQDTEKIDEIKGHFIHSINSYYKKDVFDSDMFDTYLNNYYLVDESFYVSRAYSNFLRGDDLRAFSSLQKTVNKSLYQKRLMRFVAGADQTYSPVKEGCNTTSDAFTSFKAMTVRRIIATFIMMIPCIAVMAGVYYLVAWILNSGAVWNNAYYFRNALGLAYLTYLPAMWLSRYAMKITLIFYGKDRRKYLSDLDKIMLPSRTGGCFGKVGKAASVALLVLTMLNANSYAVFNSDNIRIPVDGYLITQYSTYTYSDVKRFVYVEGRETLFGGYLKTGEYYLVFDDGKEFNLSFEVSGRIVKDKIEPILSSHGIELTTAHDASELSKTNESE